jgi:rSAM/selenodomain-associated transferase 2
MAPTLGIVIPVLNEATGIGSLLEQLARQFPGVPRIVVDGGSSDATVPVAMPQCEQLLIGRAGRAVQMNLGAAGLDTDYLVFLHADTRPLFDLARFERHLQAEPVWGFCPVRLSGTHWLLRWVERGMNWRSRLTGIGTGDQMLFVRRNVFEAQGGFAELPLMEDVELCKRLRKTAPPLVLGDPVVTSSRRWEERGIVRTVLQMWSLRFAYFMGVSPVRLWQAYYG